MGVRRTDHLMFAVDAGYDNCDFEKFEAEICGKPERRFDVVYDGMCGGYALAGKIIATSDHYDGFKKTKIDPSNLEIDQNALASKVSEAFGRKFEPSDFSLILFSHFS